MLDLLLESWSYCFGFTISRVSFVILESLFNWGITDGRVTFVILDLLLESWSYCLNWNYFRFWIYC
jgi:hypothetical protein